MAARCGYGAFEITEPADLALRRRDSSRGRPEHNFQEVPFEAPSITEERKKRVNREQVRESPSGRGQSV
jgi:hypothetical protein